MQTDWEAVKKYTNMWRKNDTEHYTKASDAEVFTPRTLNHCALGKVIIKPIIRTTSVGHNGDMTYIYQFNASDIYAASMRFIHDNDLDLLSNEPAMRRAKVFGLDPDSITGLVIHSNGNPVDGVKGKQIDAIRRYYDIKDKRYLPLACYKHYLPLSFYGSVYIDIEATKPAEEDLFIEAEYSMISANQLSCEGLEEYYNRQKSIHNNWMEIIADNKYVFHYSETCRMCNGDTIKDVNDIKLQNIICSYLPQIRNRIWNNFEFEVRYSPILVLFTDEKENSTIKIKYVTINDVFNNHEIPNELEFASIQPGIYPLVPYNTDSIDLNFRKLNGEYFLGRGNYRCNKPVLFYLESNFIMSSDGTTVLRYY